LESRTGPTDVQKGGPSREQIQRRIQEIQREILATENGDLYETIAEQTSAPSCTICEEGPLGFPGQPTTSEERVRALRKRLRALENELARTEQA
jgi:hypothetical protein